MLNFYIIGLLYSHLVVFHEEYSPTSRKNYIKIHCANVSRRTVLKEIVIDYL